jgi:hypothetical protein
MDVKGDRRFEIIDTLKNNVKFEAWDKWKILLKKSMKSRLGKMDPKCSNVMTPPIT